LLPDLAAERDPGWSGGRLGSRPIQMRTAKAWLPAATPYLQVAPLVAVFLAFLVFPIILIAVVSFWDYTEYAIVPDLILRNYAEVFTSAVTYKTYFSTIKFAAITWAVTLMVGFTVAYFLAFHVRTLKWQMTLFLVCTIPFWTSNVIRMISWIPFLGRNGILNSTLLSMGVIDKPLEFLLFSEFSTVLAYVHLYALFMVVPIFNSMMRIERSLIEAAVDCGASGWRVVKEVVLPLSKPGIAIGSIFVVTLVMGDFVTVRLMSGGQSASVALMMSNQLAYLQYPAAAANAIVLLVVVLLIVAAMMRIVDIRKEL
jgi:putative spermidine/putrescine transport system permease protein